MIWLYAPAEVTYFDDVSVLDEYVLRFDVSVY